MLEEQGSEGDNEENNGNVLTMNSIFLLGYCQDKRIETEHVFTPNFLIGNYKEKDKTLREETEDNKTLRAESTTLGDQDNHEEESSILKETEALLQETELLLSSSTEKVDHHDQNEPLESEHNFSVSDTNVDDSNSREFEEE